jgi:hypothetical protein
MAPQTAKPLDKSKTVVHAQRPQNGLDRRNSWRLGTRVDRGSHRPPQPVPNRYLSPSGDADPAAGRVRLNHVRPAASRSENLLVLSGGQPVKVETCSRQLNRAGHVAAFRVHAHKFRHTFATTYLRNSGDIERLRKILGHTTYAMVMRYVHLDASDLDVDFDDRSAFKCPPTIRLDELCQSRLGPSISPPPIASLAERGREAGGLSLPAAPSLSSDL